MENIWKGEYLRYDGRLVHVVGMIENMDTGDKYILCRINARKKQNYYIVTREAFREKVLVGDKTVPKYRRFSISKALSESEAEFAFEHNGEYPAETAVKIRRGTPRRGGDAYIVQAKEMCEKYLRDSRLLHDASEDSEDYVRAKKNVMFLRQCLENELKDYAGYFRERFVEGKSIRKYAEAHGIKRGAVDYTQTKFFTALAQCLKEREGEWTGKS